MTNDRLTTTAISTTAARLSIAASVLAIIFLASLHLLSPEFDASWRMVSEYALGKYSWVLSLMFVSWAIGSWALAYVLRNEVQRIGGKIGLIFLITAGIGEAMASVFDVRHSLHGVAAIIGIPSLPIAALLISVSLSRTIAWLPAKKWILWTANLTWISWLLMTAAVVIMIVTFSQAGGDMSSEPSVDKTLPPGVIAFSGYANRFLILVYCVWVITVAWMAIVLRGRR